MAALEQIASEVSQPEFEREVGHRVTRCHISIRRMTISILSPPILAHIPYRCLG